MMDRRTAIKHLGGVTSALLLTKTLRGQALPAGQTAATAQPPTGPFTLPPMPTTRWSLTSTQQPCTFTTTSTTRPT
jgi:hypothetical protein